MPCLASQKLGQLAKSYMAFKGKEAEDEAAHAHAHAHGASHLAHGHADAYERAPMSLAQSHSAGSAKPAADFSFGGLVNGTQAHGGYGVVHGGYSDVTTQMSLQSSLNWPCPPPSSSFAPTTTAQKHARS